MYSGLDYLASLKIKLFSIYVIAAMCTSVAMDTCLSSDSVFGTTDERVWWLPLCAVNTNT